MKPSEAEKRKRVHRKVVKKYKADRLELISQLGGKCVRCEETRPRRLEFHHIRERTWVARELSRWSRMKRYREEAEAGEIELLCRSCNAKLGKPSLDGSGFAEDDQPF